MIKVIGIAGGIGSGKSTVTDYLRERNYTVIDADEVARESVMPGEPAVDELIDFFGKEILNDDGSLNRRKLAQIAFCDQKKTEKLNEILHKDISHRIDMKVDKFIQKNDVFLKPGQESDKAKRLLFISAPLFFEAVLDRKCDETWAVTADMELRIKRTELRDGLPRKEILDRMSKQLTDEQRAARADYTISNEGTREELISQIDKLLV